MLNALMVQVSPQVSRRCRPGLKQRRASSSLKSESCCLLLLPDSFLGSIPSPLRWALKALTPNWGQDMRRGYGTSAVMDGPRGCDHLLHLPLKVQLQVDLWKSGGSVGVAAAQSYERPRHVSAHSALSLPFLIYRWGRFYRYTLFLQFLIKRKYRRLPDLLIEALWKDWWRVCCWRRRLGAEPGANADHCRLFFHTPVTLLYNLTDRSCDTALLLRSACQILLLQMLF